MKHARAGQPRLMAQRLLALMAAGVLLFNFPLLKLWLTENTVFGLPLLPVALFGAWALLIVLLARLMESRGED
jgi:hypothetical protein